MTVGTPFKQVDFRPCVGCNKGVAHANGLMFYRLSFERMVLNGPAIRRQHGLEMMLGNAAIARVMGPDEKMADPLGDPVHALLCDDCAMRFPLAALDQIHSERAENETADFGRNEVQS